MLLHGGVVDQGCSLFFGEGGMLYGWSRDMNCTHAVLNCTHAVLSRGYPSTCFPPMNSLGSAALPWRKQLYSMFIYNIVVKSVKIIVVFDNRNSIRLNRCIIYS